MLLYTDIKDLFNNLLVNATSVNCTINEGYNITIFKDEEIIDVAFIKNNKLFVMYSGSFSKTIISEQSLSKSDFELVFYEIISKYNLKPVNVAHFTSFR